MKVRVLIPAYKPSPALPGIVERLIGSSVAEVVVVDDGSGAEHRQVFDRVAALPRTRVLRHAVNLGKGAALKTGINYCLCEDPGDVIVTADADGQHLPEDILRIAETATGAQGALVLGVRGFEGDVPLRSRFGNAVTRLVLRAVLGFSLKDTQTGLRAIPAGLAPELLKLRSQRYEFELDMLVLCKQMGVKVVQSDIQTVYLDGNQSSHFNPLVDSMRIYFTLVRYMVVSLGTALVDNLTFILLFPALQVAGGTQWATAIGQVVARLVAMAFNYSGLRRLVFASKQPARRVIPKYLALVAFSGTIAYSAIIFVSERFHLNVVVAKVLVETALFLPNFVIQRDLIFRAPLREELEASAES